MAERVAQVSLSWFECEAILMGLRRLKMTRPPSPASESADARVSDALRKLMGDFSPPDDPAVAESIFLAGTDA